MTLAIDFGSANVRTILFDEKEPFCHFFTFNLGFNPPFLSRASLLFLARLIEKQTGKVLIKKNRIEAKVLACVGLPVYEENDLLAEPVILTGQALAALEINVLSVNNQVTLLGERVSIAPVKVDQVLNWIPFKADLTDVGGYIENLKVYSSILPTTPRDLYFEQAIAKARIAEMVSSQKISSDLTEVFLTGDIFLKIPYHAQSLLVLLDGFQPVNPLKVWLDQRQILPAAGLLKHYYLNEYSHLGDEFNPLLLGTVIPLFSDCEVEINLGFESPQVVNLRRGDLYFFPLKMGETAGVSVRTANSTKGKKTYEVTGGSVGLVFDLRGRPLVLPEAASLRYELLKKWDQSLGASGQIEPIG